MVSKKFHEVWDSKVNRYVYPCHATSAHQLTDSCFFPLFESPSISQSLAARSDCRRENLSVARSCGKCYFPGNFDSRLHPPITARHFGVYSPPSRSRGAKMGADFLKNLPSRNPDNFSRFIPQSGTVTAFSSFTNQNLFFPFSQREREQELWRSESVEARLFRTYTVPVYNWMCQRERMKRRSSSTRHPL